MKHNGVIGGLSTPNKMPCYSYSLPLKTCGTSKKLALGPKSVCGRCYAERGFYNMPAVVEAMQTRYECVMQALSQGSRFDRFVTVFSNILNRNYKNTCRMVQKTGKPPRRDGRYFRWHDSGDLVSLTHLKLIAEIARKCPDVKFWLPTKEFMIVKNFVKLWEIPPNLIIRLSLPNIDQSQPTGLIAHLVDKYVNITYSHVKTQDYFDFNATVSDTCPSSDQQNQCKNCRRCWNPDAVSVGYILH